MHGADTFDEFDEPTIGIDVGGTKCLAVLRHGSLEVLRAERPTPVGSGSLIETIVSLVEELEIGFLASGAGSSDRAIGVGVGLPGLVTYDGRLRAAPNLVDVVELDAAGALSERLGRRVLVDNDATCSAIAEWLGGAGRGCRDLVVVTIGTGIGAGVVSNGELVKGAHGFAGEIGHMFVDPAGPPCPCGRTGCWERYASGSGLAFLAQRFARRHSGGELARSASSVEGIRGEHVAALAAAGSSEALEVLDEFARWIAVGLSNMTNVLDPECFVLGGGASRMGDVLVERVRRSLGDHLYASEHRPHPRIEAAFFGESAGAVGAGMLSRLRRP